MCLWGLSSPKSGGQDGGLEAQRRADVAVVSPKVAWSRIPSFLGGPQSFLLRPLTKWMWMRPIHIMEGDLFLFKVF